MKSGLQKEAANALKAAKARCGKTFCSNCHTSTDGKLKCGGCSKEKSLNPVYYCNRDCQKSHWKQGGHKKICGQPINFAGQLARHLGNTETLDINPTKVQNDCNKNPNVSMMVTTELTGYTKPVRIIGPIWSFASDVISPRHKHEVILKGMDLTPELNGKSGKVVKFDQETFLFHVQLKNKGKSTKEKTTVAVKATNLIVLRKTKHDQQIRQGVKSVRKCITKWFKRERTGKANFSGQDIAEVGQDCSMAFWYAIPGVEVYDENNPAHADPQFVIQFRDPPGEGWTGPCPGYPGDAAEEGLEPMIGQMDAQTMAQDLIEQSSSSTYADLFKINDIVQIKVTGVIGRITKVPREDVAERAQYQVCFDPGEFVNYNKNEITKAPVKFVNWLKTQSF